MHAASAHRRKSRSAGTYVTSTSAPQPARSWRSPGPYPLATPQLEDTVTVAPGERVSVLVHATEAGAWAWHCHILNHAERADGMFGMVTALVVQ